METKAAPLSTDLHKLPSLSPASDQATGQAGQQKRALSSRFAKGADPASPALTGCLHSRCAPTAQEPASCRGSAQSRAQPFGPPHLARYYLQFTVQGVLSIPSSLSDTRFGFFVCLFLLLSLYQIYNFVSFHFISTDLEPLFYVAAWQQTEVILGAKRASCPEQ